MSKINNIIQNIPNWLSMRNNSDSNGYKFLSTFGLELDDVDDVLNELEDNMYIATADITTPDYVYKIDLAQLYETNDILIVESSIPTVDSIYSLFKSTVQTGMFDETSNTFYVNNYKAGNRITVTVFSALVDENGMPKYNNNEYIKNKMILTTTQVPALHHIWNCFDEFALLLGLERLPRETNSQLRSRIISAITSPPGSNKSSLTASISRDLGINPSTINIKGLNDVEVYDNRNNISSTFMSYINQLSNVQKILTPKWDAEIIDEKILSIEYIPRLYTNILDQIRPEHIQSGIGDLDDLYVEAPTKESDTQDFTVYVGLMADKELKSTVYPRHDFQVVVDAVGSIPKEIHSPKDLSFSVVAAENKPLSFKVEATQGYKDDLAIPSSVIQNATVVDNGGTPSATTASKSSSVDFVPSNKLFHSNEQLLRVHIKLDASSDKKNAPTISNMKVNYKKTNGTLSFVNVDLTRSEDNVKNDEGVLTIQKGQYYNTFAYRNDFKNGGVPDENILIGDTAGIWLPAPNAQ